jgi:hypothetical protein
MKFLILSIIPYSLILYYIVKYSKEQLYLLGIPFLMFMGPSILFNQVSLITKLSWVFDLTAKDNLLFYTLILTWLIITFKLMFSRQNHPKRSTNYFTIPDFLVLTLAVLLTVSLIIAYNLYYVHDNMWTEYTIILSMFLGYFIVKSILQKFTLEQIKNFLYTLVIINSISSFLYILHQGLQITIFTADEYSIEYFQGQLITRTFLFMPILWFFSISYLFIFKELRSPITIILLAINFLGVFISYTRSAMMNAVIMALLYYILNGIRNNDISSVVKNFVRIGALGIVFFAAVSYFLPTNTDFFLSRFEEMQNSPRDEESNTLIYRFVKTGEVFEKLDAGKSIIGFGPVTSAQVPWVEVVKSTTADLVWTEVVFRWGYLGLVLFAALYIISLVKAYFIYLKSDGNRSKLAILILLVVFSQIIEGFASSTFMTPHRFALSLWYFSILSVLITSEEKIDEETQIINNEE